MELEKLNFILNVAINEALFGKNKISGVADIDKIEKFTSSFLKKSNTLKIIEKTGDELILLDKFDRRLHIVKYGSGSFDIDIDGSDVILSKEDSAAVIEFLNE